MNLPNFFLADLPAEAHLTEQLITDACHTLARNRQQHLAARTTQNIIRIISETAQHWLRPDYPFRQMALDLGPAATGFSRATLLSGLEHFFAQLTPENLHSLLIQEFGHPQRLDRMVASPPEAQSHSASIAHGPELLVHIAAGNLPTPTLTSIVFGLLVRSAQFVKCATGSSLLPRLFAHSLYDADPKIGSCLEIAEWPGGKTSLETALYHAADCLTATGEDATLDTIRRHLPQQVRFLGYGHRVSFGYISPTALSLQPEDQIVRDAAADVVAWNQLGCLSPHLFYVERAGRLSPEHFAEKLAGELAAREDGEPRGPLPPETAAHISSKRGFYLVRSDHSPETRIWSSENSTAWTVVYEENPLFQPSCLNRFIYVKPATDLDQALHHAECVQGKVSTVGIAADHDASAQLAARLAAWGVTRVCPRGRMQPPPLTWRHDGRPPLADLITWTNWEQTF